MGFMSGPTKRPWQALEARIGKRPDGKPWDGTMTLREAGVRAATYHEPIKRPDYGWDRVRPFSGRIEFPARYTTPAGPVYSDGSPVPLDS